MKKINSIGYGGKVIGCGIVLAAIVPLTLKLVSLLVEKPIFPLIGKISHGVGAVILIGFAVLLAIEFHQDKKLNIYYESKQNERRALPNNLFERTACGNRQVAPQDKSCHVCGIHFKL